MILKRIFSINTINEKKGMLLIGDLPGKQYKTFCNVTTDSEDLDDMYKESWVCHLTHVGFFKISKGISNIISAYHELENTDLVNFDSAYDYIAVPISEKEIIEQFLQKANLQCEEKGKNDEIKSNEELKQKKLKSRIREEEISIICDTNIEELRMKSIALSFVLQGYVYSLPLDLLFRNYPEEGKMEMLIRYIDDDDAIWTFGYPFMNQFLTIFNMEDSHVGIKKLKKTALPIVNINKDWENKRVYSRCYGDNKNDVVKYGIATMKFFQKHGLISVVKHFPGYGLTNKDVHFKIPKINNYLRLNKKDARVFEEAIKEGAEVIMTTHMRIKGYGLKQVTINKKFINDYLIDKYHYDNIIMTDDIRIGIYGKIHSTRKLIIKSINAGHHLVLFKYLPYDYKKVFSKLYTMLMIKK